MHRFRSHRRSINELGHAHELTFSCFHGFPLLAKERTCTWLASSIEEACTEMNFQLWAYVFMPNHVHLIVCPMSLEHSISHFLSRIKQPTSRRAIAYLRCEAPLWLEKLAQTRGTKTEYHFWQRGGGYDRNVTDVTTLSKMIDYIHLNPVRKELVQRASNWKWSSAGWFEDQQPNALKPHKIPPDWLT